MPIRHGEEEQGGLCLPIRHLPGGHSPPYDGLLRPDGGVIRLGTGGWWGVDRRMGPRRGAGPAVFCPSTIASPSISWLAAPGVSLRVALVVPGSGHRVLSRHYPGRAADAGPWTGIRCSGTSSRIRPAIGFHIGQRRNYHNISTSSDMAEVLSRAPRAVGSSIRTGWLLLGVILILIVLCEAGLRLSIGGVPRTRAGTSMCIATVCGRPGTRRRCACSPSALIPSPRT